MNKNRLVLLGFGFVLCGGVTAVYLTQWALPSGPKTGSAPPPSVAKVAPKPVASPASERQANDQDVPTSVAPSEAKPQPEVSEQAKRFQDALASGDAKQTLDALTAWAKANPAAAAKFVESMKPGPQRDRLLREVAQRWAAQDRAAALDWATHIGTASEGKQMVEAIYWQVGQTNPQAAISLVESSGGKGNYASVKGYMAEQWAAKDPSAALNWALAQPKGDERNQFVAELASVRSRTSPSEAARLVLQEIPEGPEQDNAALAVLDGWARKDLTAATAWANQFPSDLQARARAVLAASHMKQTP
jgi:hypothetical protein